MPNRHTRRGAVNTRSLAAVIASLAGIGLLAFTIWRQTPTRSFAPARGGPGPGATIPPGAPGDFTQAVPRGKGDALIGGPGAVTQVPAPANFQTIVGDEHLANALDRFEAAVAEKVGSLKPAKPLPATTAVAPTARAALAAWLADKGDRSMALAVAPDALDTDRVSAEADSPFPGGTPPPGGGVRRGFTGTPGITAPPTDGKPERRNMMVAPAPAPGEAGSLPAPGSRTVHASVPVHPKDAKAGTEITVTVMLTYDAKAQKWAAGPVSVSGDGDTLKDAMQKIRSAK